jgi:hypothetical protein
MTQSRTDWPLRPKLVPRPLQRRSVFHALKRDKRWKEIRQLVIARAGGCCEICGESREKGMICHEVWQYDDGLHVARLTGFQLICPPCNLVLHVGGSGNIWGGDPSGTMSADATTIALEHLMRVNCIQFDEAIAMLVEANHEFDERSKHQWSVVVDKALVEEFPVLDNLTI